MPRILFVKTSSLGDVIHHCPAVSDAAHCVPGAEIDWVLEDAFRAIADLHPAVRRVIPVALRRWRARPWSPATWAEMRAARRALVQERYDHIIDTQGLLKSALLGRLAAGLRHGFDRGSAREPLAALFYDVTHAVGRERHAVERNRALTASALGYALPQQWRYGLAPRGVAPMPMPDRYVVLITMTSRADKLWPERCWIELGAALESAGLSCVLPWGSAREQARCVAIAGSLAHALVLPRLELSTLAPVLAQARAVAGLDTGLTHLAVALGVRTIGIYCASEPALTGLYGDEGVVSVGGPGRVPAVNDVLVHLLR